MSFRTVVISSKAKLSYKNDYMLVKTDENMKSVHLSEIDTVIIDSTMVSISAYLLRELARNKINTIFCDEKRNPYGELVAYYNCHNSFKKISNQIKWSISSKQIVWQEIIKQKIHNQKEVLKKANKETYQLLNEYMNNIEVDDSTNREGHAAKVYFNSLFGTNFSRTQDNDINAALNYGYAIILSYINKEVICNGYLTQLGIKHKNEFNEFNLTCDLMEPFRPIIDEFVYNNKEIEFTQETKLVLIDLLNQRITYQNKKLVLSDIIKLYVKSIFNALDNNDSKLIEGFYLYEEQDYEDDCII